MENRTQTERFQDHKKQVDFYIKKWQRYQAWLGADGSRQQIAKDFEESYSPVMKTESSRTLLKIASTNNYKIRFFDVEIAYLNGKLERTVYMDPPEGLNVEEGKVLHVTGSLYGLPEAGWCWYKKLMMILHKMKLKPCKADPSIFINKRNEKYIEVGIYVVDGVIVGESNEVIDQYTCELRDKN